MTKDLAPKDFTEFDFSLLFPQTGDSSTLLVSCARSDYSASAIARAVEDCDARVLNLNVTSLAAHDGEAVVALRVDHRNPGSIARSLSRYGFEVINVHAASQSDTDVMRERANEVLRYLDI